MQIRVSHTPFLERLCSTARKARPAVLAVILASVLGPLVSCRSIPRYYISSTTPHKDSVVLTVFLESPQDASVYEKIARRELASILESEERRAIPLYEVRLEFYGSSYPHRKYAVVSTYLDDPPLARASDYDVPVDDFQLEVLGSDATASGRSWSIYLY